MTHKPWNVGPFTLAVSSEMVFRNLLPAERARRIHQLGFQVEIWDWTRHDIAGLRATGATCSSMTGDVFDTLAEDEGTEELLRTAALSIQVADVPGRCEPGTGEIHYPAVARALAKMGFRGTVGLEGWASGDDERALQRFRDAFSVQAGRSRPELRRRQYVIVRFPWRPAPALADDPAGPVECGTAMTRKATSRDVADAAGVSKWTVARSLSTKTTHQVAVLVSCDAEASMGELCAGRSARGYRRPGFMSGPCRWPPHWAATWTPPRPRSASTC